MKINKNPFKQMRSFNLEYSNLPLYQFSQGSEEERFFVETVFISISTHYNQHKLEKFEKVLLLFTYRPHEQKPNKMFFIFIKTAAQLEAFKPCKEPEKERENQRR